MPISLLVICPNDQSIPDVLQQANLEEYAAPNHPDLFVLNPEEKLTVALVRQNLTQMTIPPNKTDRRVVLIRGVDQVGGHVAQQSLLKIVEEPPDQVQLVLTAQSEYSVLPTLRSRCLVVKAQIASSGGENDASTSHFSPRLDPRSLPPAEIWQLIESHAERESAIDWCEALITHLSQELTTAPMAATSSLIAQLLQALPKLRQNAHTRLTLYHALKSLFFTSSATPPAT